MPTTTSLRYRMSSPHLLEELDQVGDDLLSTDFHLGLALPPIGHHSLLRDPAMGTQRQSFVAAFGILSPSGSIFAPRRTLLELGVLHQDVLRLVTLHNGTEVFQVHFVVMCVEFSLSPREGYIAREEHCESLRTAGVEGGECRAGVPFQALGGPSWWNLSLHLSRQRGLLQPTTTMRLFPLASFSRHYTDCLAIP